MNKLIVYQTCQVRKFMTCFARIFLIICNVLQCFANCSPNEGQSSDMCLCVWYDISVLRQLFSIPLICYFLYNSEMFV